MLDFQRLVGEFHDAIGEQSPISPTMPDEKTRMLRARLISEEAQETIDALLAGDLVEAVDGLADMLYVVFGTADALGVDLDPVFEEVHRTNLAKGNKRDEHGKVRKPANWEPPRIRELLEKMGWQGK